jgi:hypothetical protein
MGRAQQKARLFFDETDDVQFGRIAPVSFARGFEKLAGELAHFQFDALCIGNFMGEAQIFAAQIQ